MFGGATLLSAHASAQPVLQRPPVVKKGELAVEQPRPPVTQNIANVLTDALSGTSEMASNGALDGVPVLNGFHFRFTNGDHELQRIWATVSSPSSARISFRDKNADDNYKAGLTWINVKGAGARGEVFAVGGGQFEIPLPTPRPANHRLVLSGFELNFASDDEDIRMIGVWLDESRHVARVSFMNWIGDTSIGGQLGNAWVPPQPYYRMRGYLTKVVPTAERLASELRAHEKDKDSIRPIGVRVQYAFIPNTMVESEDYFTGTTRAPASGKVFKARAGIQGFEFWFDNKAHHILELGVMPPLAGSAARSRVSAPGEYVAFQDQNRDDPIKWAVKLLNLKP
ncbi:MAG: hypothetical protein BGO98_27925 [Myxococcales bacterium 68-20]|nr:MAG: hypothetical protein BGO98_27925 [Myxococcales bacterium 68-20]